MANKETNELTAIGTPALGDLIPVYDIDDTDELRGMTLQQAFDLYNTTYMIDEDNMVSDSETKVPTQQSTKAYVDNAISGLTKSDVGLSNVDNTSDASKPISTATQTALDDKAAASHTHTESDITDLQSYALTTRKLDDFGTPDDNTDLDATALLHGLMSKADKSKLDGIESGATSDQSDAEIKTAYENNTNTNAFTDADETKLDGIESGATANDTDANLKNRANHTGTQLASTISDFDTQVKTNKLDDMSTPDDNTDLDATTGRHGLLPKLGGGTTNFLRADGTWAAPAGGGGGSVTESYSIPLTLEVPEGTIAYPDVHTLATASAKVTGFVLPDGASASTINFKGVIPKDLHATPAMAIRFRIMTLGAVAGPADVRLTVSTVGIADGESLDTALTAETETTVTMPTATETLDYYEQDLTTDWAESDTLIGKLQRDPTDASDDFTDDIMIVGADLIVERTLS